ncbi:hypothetical protein [Plasticicumulans acidivorans]|uniref:hypothetical protein n=1 Tax=Plasticicumulans acidivorans TaxID=886464 RepID=UPI000D71C92B|nr:hypothetical protein [Plasticicumulans acidivorans]
MSDDDRSGSGIAALIGIISLLFGTGGIAYGLDQRQKRKKEQAANRARLQQIEAELTLKELQLVSLRNLLGDKNEQVRILATEITRLRSAANEMRRLA